MDHRFRFNLRRYGCTSHVTSLAQPIAIPENPNVPLLMLGMGCAIQRSPVASYCCQSVLLA